MNNWHNSQRGYFAGALYDAMEADDRIYLILVDLGYRTFDRHIQSFPDRVILTGASEQAAMGIAVGLAQSGMKPFVYTITSFFLRCAETISLYVKHEKAPVRLVGAGRDKDYLHDGISHFGKDAQNFIKRMRILGHYPDEKEQVEGMVKHMVDNDKPQFISLRR